MLHAVHCLPWLLLLSLTGFGNIFISMLSHALRCTTAARNYCACGRALLLLDSLCCKLIQDMVYGAHSISANIRHLIPLRKIFSMGLSLRS
jgi:hypothetical protein